MSTPKQEKKESIIVWPSKCHDRKYINIYLRTNEILIRSLGKINGGVIIGLGPQFFVLSFVILTILCVLACIFTLAMDGMTCQRIGFNYCKEGGNIDGTCFDNFMTRYMCTKTDAFVKHNSKVEVGMVTYHFTVSSWTYHTY